MALNFNQNDLQQLAGMPLAAPAPAAPAPAAKPSAGGVLDWIGKTMGATVEKLGVGAAQGAVRGIEGLSKLSSRMTVVSPNQTPAQKRRFDAQQSSMKNSQDMLGRWDTNLNNALNSINKNLTPSQQNVSDIGQIGGAVAGGLLGGPVGGGLEAMTGLSFARQNIPMLFSAIEAKKPGLIAANTAAIAIQFWGGEVGPVASTLDKVGMKSAAEFVRTMGSSGMLADFGNKPTKEIMQKFSARVIHDAAMGTAYSMSQQAAEGQKVDPVSAFKSGGILAVALGGTIRETAYGAGTAIQGAQAKTEQAKQARAMDESLKNLSDTYYNGYLKDRVSQMSDNLNLSKSNVFQSTIQRILDNRQGQIVFQSPEQADAAHGVDVQSTELPNGEAGRTTQSKDGYTIKINKNLSPEETQNALWHERGHVIYSEIGPDVAKGFSESVDKLSNATTYPEKFADAVYKVFRVNPELRNDPAMKDFTDMIDAVYGKLVNVRHEDLQAGEAWLKAVEGGQPAPQASEDQIAKAGLSRMLPEDQYKQVETSIKQQSGGDPTEEAKLWAKEYNKRATGERSQTFKAEQDKQKTAAEIDSNKTFVKNNMPAQADMAEQLITTMAGGDQKIEAQLWKKAATGKMGSVVNKLLKSADDSMVKNIQVGLMKDALTTKIGETAMAKMEAQATGDPHAYWKDVYNTFIGDGLPKVTAESYLQHYLDTISKDGGGQPPQKPPTPGGGAAAGGGEPQPPPAAQPRFGNKPSETTGAGSPASLFKSDRTGGTYTEPKYAPERTTSPEIDAKAQEKLKSPEAKALEQQARGTFSTAKLQENIAKSNVSQENLEGWVKSLSVGSSATAEEMAAARQGVMNLKKQFVDLAEEFTRTKSDATKEEMTSTLGRLVEMNAKVNGLKTEWGRVGVAMKENVEAIDFLKIQKLAKDIEKIDPSLPANMVLEQVNAKVGERFNQSPYLRTWYRMLFSGPSTISKIADHSSGNAATETFTRTVVTAITSPASIPEVLSSAISGGIRGMKASADFLTGKAANAEIDSLNRETNKFFQFLGRARVAAAESTSGFATGALEGLMRSRGESEAAIKEASSAYGQKVTFHSSPDQKTFFGQVYRVLQTARNSDNVVLNTMMHLLIPVAKITSNIGQAGIELFGARQLPIPLVEGTLAALGKELDLTGGKIKVKDLNVSREEQEMMVGRMLVGVGAMTALVYKAWNDPEFITAGGPTSKGVAGVAQAAHIPKYSIRIGNSYVPYIYFGPIAAVFAAAGAVSDARHYGTTKGKPTDLATNILQAGLAVGTNEMNYTGLYGLQQVMSLFSGGTQAATTLKSFPAKFAASAIPNPKFLTDWIGYFQSDKTLKKADTKAGIPTQVAQQAILNFHLNNAPFVKQAFGNIPSDQDVWGQSIQQDAIYNLSPRKSAIDTTSRELIRLGVGITAPSQTMAVGNQSITLPTPVYHIYAFIAGQTKKASLDQLVTSDQYTSATDEAKVTMIQDVVRQSEAVAKKQLYDEFPELNSPDVTAAKKETAAAKKAVNTSVKGFVAQPQVPTTTDTSTTDQTTGTSDLTQLLGTLGQ